MTTWKATERAVMKRLGGRRIPITGRQRGDVPDGEHDWLAVEIKHRKEIALWLRDAMAQAVACSEGGAKLPIVVIHELGRRHDDNLVMIRQEDFEQWFGGMGDADD